MRREVRSETLGVTMRVPAEFVAHGGDLSGLTLVRPGTGPADFEMIQVSRHRRRGGDVAADWHAELSRRAAEGGWRDILLAPLQLYPVAGQVGKLGVMGFTDGAGVVTGAALWCGRVDGDTVALLYRCGTAREPSFATTVGGLLDGLAFSERDYTGSGKSTGHARPANPRFVFGLNLAVAIALVLIGLWFRNA